MQITELEYRSSESMTTNPPRTSGETILCKAGTIETSRYSSCGSYSSTTRQKDRLNAETFSALCALVDEAAFRDYVSRKMLGGQPAQNPAFSPLTGGSRFSALTICAEGVSVSISGADTAPFAEVVKRLFQLRDGMGQGGYGFSGMMAAAMQMNAAPGGDPPARAKDEAEAAGKPRFCHACGSPAQEGQPFCSECGAPLPAPKS